MSRLRPLMKNVFSIFLLLLISACTQSQSNPSDKSFLGSQIKREVTSSKSTGYFRVTLNSQNLANGKIQLNAVITVQRSMKQADFEWKLPSSISVIEGDLKNHLTFDQSPSQTVSIQLSEAEAMAADPIFFFVYQVKNGERHGASTSWLYSNNEPAEKASKMNLKSKKTPKYFE